MTFHFNLIDRWLTRVVFWVEGVRQYCVPVAAGQKRRRRVLRVQVIYLQQSVGYRHFGVVAGVVLNDWGKNSGENLRLQQAQLAGADYGFGASLNL